MSNFSNLTIAGRLVRDPETKTVGEHTVTNVTIAYDSGFGEKKKAVFIKVQAWNKTGTALARLAKGEPVLLNGELAQENWEKEGQKRSEHVMRVQTVTYISGKKDGAEAPRNAPNGPTVPRPAVGGGTDSIDEPPFAAPFGNW